ncbi:MAG: DUF1330 domain-containing protein [Anaerolineaceae bacterium]
MAQYSVVSVTPTSDTWIPSYLEAVGPLVEKHGGRYLARTANHELVEGSGSSPALQVIIEWPSKESADAFYADPGYAPHRAARLSASESSWFSIAGQDDFAAQ